MKIFAIGLLSLACQMTFGATIEFVGITTLSHGKSLSGDGSAISGMSHSADGLGGYSLATVQTGAASASASWYWPFGWYDWSKGQVWDTWRLELQLSGAPSEQAEIFADLSFLAGSVLTAYPSGLYASGSTAHGYSNMGIEIFGLNDGTPFNYTQSFLYDEAVVWMGAGGGVDSASYSTSLGIFGVGSLFYVDVSAHGFATAYANPHGSVAANLWSNSTLKLSPESLPTPVPVPGTLGLLGLGLAGLGLIRRGQHRAST